MCLILFAYRTHRAFDLLVAANRDEYYDRPSAPPRFWDETPHLLAGRDLLAGGTWLGVTRQGRFGAVTNYRDPDSLQRDAPSRGNLVYDFLRGDEDASLFLERLSGQGHLYNGFNLVLGDRDGLYWYSNRDGRILRMPPGLYGVSNRLLDTPWPKVVRGKEMLGEALQAADSRLTEALFQILRDQVHPPDRSLPSTGVGLEWERILSPIFISSPTYGTRSSTLLLMGKDRRTLLLDRSFGPAHGPVDSRKFEFMLQP